MSDYKISIEREYDDPTIVASALADIIVDEGRVSKDRLIFVSSRIPRSVSVWDVILEARRNAANTLRLFRSTYGQFPKNDRRLDLHRAYIRSRLPVYRRPSTPYIIRAVRSVRQFFHNLEKSTRPVDPS